ncbi:hypothetical protein PoB_003384600 [Plakobranchus ocellatus]|uniref:Uncharacterized protein n=1 Tax=Plakobranchus ocellatus TaxID=259542 RepID=A0AAV4AGC2_9GAST|nr:hypothetical protein PoB_003384600 [Plakobranchus ocellatus]
MDNLEEAIKITGITWVSSSSGCMATIEPGTGGRVELDLPQNVREDFRKSSPTPSPLPSPTSIPRDWCAIK